MTHDCPPTDGDEGLSSWPLSAVDDLPHQVPSPPELPLMTSYCL